MKSKLNNIMDEIKIEIFGRVQGVGFRHFVKENADRLGLTGFVRNKDEGSVTIIAQGEKEKLNELFRSVHRGPQFANVRGVSYFWRNAINKYDDFIIALDKGILEDQTRNFLNLGKSFLNIRGKIPNHIAIIPDGNRRWATSKGLDPGEGHKKSGSFENLLPLLEEAQNIGVKYVTFWAFSTENWNRSKGEIRLLFDLISKWSKEFREYAVRNQIRFRHIGRRDRLPKRLMREIEKAEEATKDFSKFNVQICLDYGGRDEIVRAINKLLKEGIQQINEGDIINYLDSSGIPDPDMIIRTSGEQRTSGFMSFQSAYAEFYFADVNFPDFSPEELRKAVAEFQSRKRRFGR